MSFLGNWWMDMLTIFALLVFCVIAYFKWSYKYWERLGVPYMKPSIPFGTIGNPLTLPESIAEAVIRQYKASRANGYKYVGLFGVTRPQFMPVDPQLIKTMMTKDFQYFTDRGFYYNQDDPLSVHLFSLDGLKWKNLRSKLTPTFTSAKIKSMMNFVTACGTQLNSAMSTRCMQGPINIKEFVERYTMDVIGNCAFGIECNSFKDSSSEFCKYTKRQFLPTKFENLKHFISFIFPSFAKLIRMKIIAKDVTKFFLGTLKKSIEYRQNSKEIRNDFLQILIDLMHADEQSNDKKLTRCAITFNELAANSFLFFLGGFESSSTTISFCLFELSVNPEVQERVRDEINAVLNNYDDVLTYDSLKEMTYLQNVIDEVLRKYPPFPILNRIAVMDYKVPNSNCTIEKGTCVTIPIVALQNDAEYFPDPEKFDPERFNEVNKENVVPFTYLPFGDGPRVCLGIRFGMMQTKIGLISLLKNYKFSLSSKTVTPFTYKPISFVMSVEGDIWLNAEKI